MLLQRIGTFLFLVLFALTAIQCAMALSNEEVSACLEIVEAIPGLATMDPSPWNTSNLASTCNGGISAAGLTCYGSILEGLTIDSSLTGSFPSAISKLSTLTSVSIDASLTGALPSAWSSLPLESLQLNLSLATSGPLPGSWSNLTQLRSLTIAFSKSSTTSISLPTWVGTVDTLSVTNGKIDDFVSFTPALPVTSMYRVMQSLYLTNVKLGPNYPTALYSRHYVQNIVIKNDPENINYFGSPSTTLPSDLSQAACSRFSLQNVAFGGSLPSAFAMCQTYEFIGLTNLVGTVPSALFNTFMVRAVILRDLPKVKGSLPSPSQSIWNQLETIEIANLGLDGTISPQLFGVNSFHSLSLSNLPHLKGSLPDTTSKCGLEHLSISSLTSLTGSIPESLFHNCSALTSITIENTRISGSLPSSMAGRRFTRLVISNNPLSGTIPNFSIGWVSGGAHISLRNSGLSGSIPLSITENELSYIDFSRNRLDLCANNGTLDQQKLSTAFSRASICDLGSQNPEACGCPEAWPASCLPPGAMDETCSPASGNAPYSWETEFPPPPPIYNSPYYNTAPAAPTVPVVPVPRSQFPPSYGVGDGPTGSAPAQVVSSSLMAFLLLILFVMN